MADSPENPTPDEGTPTGDSPSASNGAAENSQASAATAPAATTGPKNVRPERVTSLLTEGSEGPNWYGANRKSNRFYILNVGKVIGDLNIEHTKTESLFERALDEINTQTEWAKYHPFEFGSSKTQIYPENRHAPKLFARAATIIVALEIASRESPRDLNVYDYLRVIPAQFFADRFNEERLNALKVHFGTFTEQERIDKFGEENKDKPFETLVLEALGQAFSERLLDQMATGFTVTKYVATKLIEFINEHFPHELHIGPLRACGDDVITKGLGRKNAAPQLRVPKLREPKDIDDLD